MSHPTRMPSSMSVGATRSPRPTTNCICVQLSGMLLIRQTAARQRKTLRNLYVQQIRQARERITFAICLTLMTYLASSVPGLMIFVHLATCASAHDFSIRNGLLMTILRVEFTITQDAL